MADDTKSAPAPAPAKEKARFDPEAAAEAMHKAVCSYVDRRIAEQAAIERRARSKLAVVLVRSAGRMVEAAFNAARDRPTATLAQVKAERERIEAIVAQQAAYLETHRTWTREALDKYSRSFTNALDQIWKELRR